MKRLVTLLVSVAVLTSLVAACAPPTPQVIEKDVVVEKLVVETVVVEKEVIVEKLVVETVVVEKEVVVEKPVVETVVVEKEVVVEKVVTATPVPAKRVLILALTTYPVLNPILTWTRNQVMAMRSVFSTLVEPTPSLEVVPHLAKSWEISDDGLEYTFHLQENVKWHDGEPLTAEDVKFTFDVLTSDMEPNPNSGLFAWNIDKVEVLDEHAVKVVMKTPQAPLLAQLSININILPKHLLEKYGFEGIPDADEYNRQPIGSGPYKITEAVPGDHITLEVFEDYWGPKPKGIDKAIFKVIPDTNVQHVQLRTGELDIVYSSPFLVQQLTGVEGITVMAASWIRNPYIGLKFTSPLFHEPEVRIALEYGLNRQEIIDTLYLGMGAFPRTIQSSALKYYFNEDLEPRHYDPEKALELLAEAGWEDTDGDGILDKDIDGDGVRDPFKFTITSDSSAEYVALGEAAIGYWTELGMDIDMEVLDRSTYVQKTQRDLAAEAYVHVRGGVADPDKAAALRCELDKAPYNYTEYCNPKLDELMLAGIRESDPEKRREIYYEIQEVAYENPPNLVITDLKDITAYNSKLKGVVEINYRDLMDHINKMWWEQ